GSASVPSDVNLVDEQVRIYNLYPYADTDDGAHLIRTKFNIDLDSPTGATAPGRSTAGSQAAILDAGSPGNQLQPGDSFPVNIGIQVPQGIDQDRISEGTITVLASAAE
ncbi:MAG: hypothetical protein R6V35_03960, partial [Candidatus Nanohaloarchaea archaeon]